MELYNILADEAEVAYRKLVGEIKGGICGFALFTDDSATYVDIAANSRESLIAKLKELRNTRQKMLYGFEYKWYTTEWSCEGGYSDFFPKSSELIGHLIKQGDAGNRNVIFESMIKALKLLSGRETFKSTVGGEEVILMISIADSEYDEEYMDRSIRELNSKTIWEQYLKEKAESNH